MRQAGGLNKFVWTLFARVFLAVIVTIWGEGPFWNVLVTERVDPPASVDISVNDLSVGKELFFERAEIDQVSFGLKPRTKTPVRAEMLRRENDRFAFQPREIKSVRGNCISQFNPDCQLIGGSKAVVSYPNSLNVRELSVSMVFSEFALIQKIDVFQRHVSAELFPGSFAANNSQPYCDTTQYDCGSRQNPSRNNQPPLTRRLYLFLGGFGGGCGISVWGWNYFYDERRCLGASLVSFGTLLITASLCLWCLTFYPWTWNWWL